MDMATRRKGKTPGGARRTEPAGQLSASELKAVRALLDQAAIREVIDRYFYCVDSGTMSDFDQVFTPDAKADYNGGQVKFNSWREVRDGMAGNLRSWNASSGNHFTTSTRIIVKGDTAKADTHAAVFLMTERGQGLSGTIMARGLRYQDDLVRTPDGWRIKYRLHHRSWNFETLGTPPSLGQAAKPARRKS
jgi:hypothetical protein